MIDFWPLSKIRNMSYVALAIAAAGCSDARNGAPAEDFKDSQIAAANDDTVFDRKTDILKTPSNVSSGENLQTVTRTADAHRHGDAELAVVLDGNLIVIEFTTPLYNVLGFEHRPETETQKAAAVRAASQLSLGPELFRFSAPAKCREISRPQNIRLFSGTADAHDHDDHHHDDSHKDVLLQYEFSCEEIESLSKLDVKLFEFFEKLSELEVTYLGPSTQKQVVLKPSQTQLDIKP